MNSVEVLKIYVKVVAEYPAVDNLFAFAISDNS